MTNHVNHPTHYNASGDCDEDGSAKYEAIKVIEDWGLGFCLGNAVKYICRAPHKGTEEQDLRKALWYVSRACEHPESVKVLQGRKFTAFEVMEAWCLPVGLGDVLMAVEEGRVTDARNALVTAIEEL
jgi:hypothetical protein